MLSRLSDRQIKALCYGAMVIVVAVEWTAVGAALFMVMMDFIMSAPKPKRQ